MTNKDKFIEIFGIDTWRHIISFSGIADRFKEFWTNPYKSEEESE